MEKLLQHEEHTEIVWGFLCAKTTVNIYLLPLKHNQDLSEIWTRGQADYFSPLHHHSVISSKEMIELQELHLFLRSMSLLENILFPDESPQSQEL